MKIPKLFKKAAAFVMAATAFAAGDIWTISFFYTYDSNVSVSKSGNKLIINSTVAISGSVRITAKRNNVPTVSSSAKLIAYGNSNCQAKCNSLVEKVNRRNKVKTFSGAIVNQIKNSIKALS